MENTRSFFSDAPATHWEEAMVLGDGHLGAMVFGDPHRETVVMNHSRLYLPLHEPLPPPNQGAILPEIRAHLAAGRYQAAAEAVVAQSHREGYGEKRWTDPFIPAFDVGVNRTPNGPVRDYRRRLDFESGLLNISWRDDGGDHRRRVFVSKTRRVLVVEESLGAEPLTLSFQPRPTDGNGGWNPAAMVQSGFGPAPVPPRGVDLAFGAAFARSWPGSPAGYVGVGRVCSRSPVVGRGDGNVVVSGLGPVLLVVALDLVVGTPFDAAFETCRRRLESIPGDFETLFQENAAALGDMAGRCGLEVGEGEGDPSSERLMAMVSKEGLCLPLLAKQVDSARYLVRSSTGDRFPNLQGMWTGTFSPPWSGDFTLNGNVQCALSAHLSGNQAELLLPFFKYLEDHLDAFRDNAKRLFGCRGIHVPSRMSTHGWNNHFDGTWPMTFWTAGAPWCARFFFDYFRYSGDLYFLKDRALPFMTEAAAFYEDFLIPGDDGFLHFSPSYSPENHPGNSESQACVDAAMEIGAARILLEDLLEAEAMLGAAAPNPRWTGLLSRLPPHLFDDDGAVKEWNTTRLAENNAHRHASHLYEVYETMGPRIAGDARLRRGLVKALQNRMAVRRGENGGIMAFGMVQLGMAAAVLGQGEDAGEAVQWLSRNFFRRNLVPTHDPGKTFNVDICGGLPAILFKMMADRWGDRVSLLPAMTNRWPEGGSHGIRLRGRLTVRWMEWTPRRVRATLVSEIDQQVRIGVGRVPADLTDQNSDFLTLKKGEERTVELPRGA